jgi:hypothetical protein
MMIAPFPIIAMIAVFGGLSGPEALSSAGSASAPQLGDDSQVTDLYIHPLWSTGTNVPTKAAGMGAYCVMKDDGNFVVYDADDKPCFQSGTKGHPGAFLRCQDDGNLVVYTRDKKPIWQSKTYSRFVAK